MNVNKTRQPVLVQKSSRVIIIVINMKHLYILFLFASLLSCSHPQKKADIHIDLNQEPEEVCYSQLFSALDYLVLQTGDTCLMSGIKKVFLDQDTLIVQDSKREGVFVFTLDGTFVKQINSIGEGPAEYTHTSAVAVDTVSNRICIYDIMGFKINTYTYQGDFVESDKLEGVIRDFAVMPDGTRLMVMPSYYKEQKSGVWLSSPHNQYIRHLLDNVPKDWEFEFLSTFYNQTPSGIYYYDRNDDRLSFITPDSATLLYQIDLKQRIPDETRKMAGPPPHELNQCAMLYDFCLSPTYLVLVYFKFGDRQQPFRWVFANRATGKVTVSKQFVNDMDTMISNENNLFYINDSTWCRMVDPQENDCNLILQFMHLK